MTRAPFAVVAGVNPGTWLVLDRRDYRPAFMPPVQTFITWSEAMAYVDRAHARHQYDGLLSQLHAGRATATDTRRFFQLGNFLNIT